jgi:hypothetical protein
MSPLFEMYFTASSFSFPSPKGDLIVCSVVVAEDLAPVTCSGQNMKRVKPPGCWSMSGAPYLMGWNLSRPLALTSPSQFCVVDVDTI